MDGEIADFIYKLNKCQHIITTNSCAGHDKFESGAQYDFVSHPYLSFIVDEIGWDIFWQCVLPEVAENLLIHVDIANEPGKISINVRAHFDDKTRFWHAVKPSFLNHFPADYHAYIEKQPTTQNQGV